MYQLSRILPFKRKFNNSSGFEERIARFVIIKNIPSQCRFYLFPEFCESSERRGFQRRRPVDHATATSGQNEPARESHSQGARGNSSVLHQQGRKLKVVPYSEIMCVMAQLVQGTPINVHWHYCFRLSLYHFENNFLSSFCTVRR